MSFKVTTAPGAEPLLVTDAVVKQTLRVIDTAEDAYITMLLGMARGLAEQLTWRAFITQQITLVMDKFPGPGAETSAANWYGPAWGTSPGPLTTTRFDGTTGNEIWLPRAPLQTVDSITYVDGAGAVQTLAPSAYLVDAISEPARITPAPDTTWPSTQARANAVTVTFTAGYGTTGAAVPVGIQHWILLMTATLYENRELVAVLGKGQRLDLLPYVDGLLVNHAVRVASPPAYWS